METLEFKYAIKRPDGKFYRGTAYGNEKDWTLEKREGFGGAFHYSEYGAHEKIKRFPAMFGGCLVVRH